MNKLIKKISVYNPVERFNLDNKKIMLICIIFIIFVYMDYSFILKPQMQSLGAKKREVTVLKNNLKSLEADLNNMRQLKASGKVTVVRKSKKIIFDLQLPSLLHDISKLANANNVRIVNIKPVREEVKGAPVKLHPVSIMLDLECGYHNFGKLINALENNEVFLAVEGFKIEAQKKDPLRQKISLTLKTYVRI